MKCGADTGGTRRAQRPGLAACVAPVLLALAAPVPALAAEAPESAPGSRLFTTPAERARLDRIRASAPVEPAADEGPPRLAAPPEPPPPVHLRGFVRRSGGPEAVWINDASTVDRRDPGGVRVDGGSIHGREVNIRLRDGRTVRLRPGQTWDPERGGVVDVLGD